MSKEKKFFPISQGRESVPFESAEEAWFWFILAQQARHDGARIAAGQGLYTRPCEPMDILKVAERLYRNRMLTMDHFHVLRHYGRRQYAPDIRRVKEHRAHKLWREAMERIEPILVRKGIVRESAKLSARNWAREALGYERSGFQGGGFQGDAFQGGAYQGMGLEAMGEPSYMQVAAE